MAIDYDELVRLAPDAVRKFEAALFELGEALMPTAEEGKPHPVDGVLDEMERLTEALWRAAGMQKAED